MTNVEPDMTDESDTEAKHLAAYELFLRGDDIAGVVLEVTTAAGEQLAGALNMDGLRDLIHAASGLFAEQVSPDHLAGLLRATQDQLREVARRQAQLDALTVPDVVGRTVPVIIEPAEGSTDTVLAVMPLGGGSGLTVSLAPQELERFVDAAVQALIKLQPTEVIEGLRNRIAALAEVEYQRRADADRERPNRVLH